MTRKLCRVHMIDDKCEHLNRLEMLFECLNFAIFFAHIKMHMEKYDFEYYES